VDTESGGVVLVKFVREAAGLQFGPILLTSWSYILPPCLHVPSAFVTPPTVYVSALWIDGAPYNHRLVLDGSSPLFGKSILVSTLVGT
jgi:hypothetical protein